MSVPLLFITRAAFDRMPKILEDSTQRFHILVRFVACRADKQTESYSDARILFSRGLSSRCYTTHEKSKRSKLSWKWNMSGKIVMWRDLLSAFYCAEKKSRSTRSKRGFSCSRRMKRNMKLNWTKQRRSNGGLPCGMGGQGWWTVEVMDLEMYVVLATIKNLWRTFSVTVCTLTNVSLLIFASNVSFFSLFLYCKNWSLSECDSLRGERLHSSCFNRQTRSYTSRQTRYQHGVKQNYSNTTIKQTPGTHYFLFSWCFSNRFLNRPILSLISSRLAFTVPRQRYLASQNNPDLKIIRVTVEDELCSIKSWRNMGLPYIGIPTRRAGYLVKALKWWLWRFQTGFYK